MTSSAVYAFKKYFGQIPSAKQNFGVGRLYYTHDELLPKKSLLWLHFDDVIKIESWISQNVKMINLQTLEKMHTILLFPQSILKRMKLLMSAKSEEDCPFLAHQQDLQNFSLLDVSKSLTIFLNHYY